MAEADPKNLTDAHTDMPSLKGRKAVITGGTTGIGRAIAVLLASEGVEVFTCGRDEQHLNDGLERINEVGKGSGVALDLAEREGLERFFAEAEKTLGSYDIAIMNAAIPADGLTKMSDDDIRYAIATDFTAYVVGAHKAAEHMKDKGDLILTGSVSAHELGPSSTVYAGMKAGVAGFAEALRKELGPKGIKVGFVEPALTGADFQYPDIPADKQREMINAEKMLRAEDIAVGVHFMLTQPRRAVVQQLVMTQRVSEEKVTSFAVDRLVLTPDDIDLARSPLAGQLGVETYVLGAFNPALTRLPNGNLLMMVRVAEALREPVKDGNVHAIRWDDSGRFVLDAWPLQFADTADPRKFELRGYGWKVMALTSLAWLLPVELSPDGLERIAIHYDRAIAPQGSYQCYGVEDARISRVGNRYLMTTCSVSPERHSTTLYTSNEALHWRFEGIVLDHQNKDMLIFEGLIDGQYWAQTRPLGALFFAYPPGSPWHAGPSINHATSPDALHWKPRIEPAIRPHAGTAATARIGGGTPPILTEVAGQRGWLTLWHGVEPKEIVGIYRTYWSLLDPDEPWKLLATSHAPLLEANPELTRPLEDQMYVRDVVFSTGIADAGDHFVVASGEADLACRITHVPKDAFVPS